MPKENAVDKHIWFNLDDPRDSRLWYYTKGAMGNGTFSAYVKFLIENDRNEKLNGPSVKDAIQEMADEDWKRFKANHKEVTDDARNKR